MLPKRKDTLNEPEEKPEEGQGKTKRRCRARNDAYISTIQKTIEDDFGLPRGSVVLVDPKEKPMKPERKIKALRKCWGYE